ncbi:MAG TPA: transglycosylase family protein [Pseudonocardia sp.]
MPALPPAGPSSRRGRHRKPGNAQRTLAKTALAASVVGIPLATAGQAEAAPDNVWDQVAKCESGGNWQINTGNGFQGGLQFTQSTWRSFGGSQFASSANKASREQQIAVAEKVLAGQGWNAWPVCSRKAGARGSSATPRVVTAKGPVASTGTKKAAGTKRTVGRKPAATAVPVPASTGRHALKPVPKATPLGGGLPGARNPVVPASTRLPELVGRTAPTPAAPLSAMALALTPGPAAGTPVKDVADSVPVAPAGALSAPRAAAAPAPARPSAATSPAGPPSLPAQPPAATAPAVPAAAPAVPAAGPAVPAPRTYQVRAGDTLSGIAASQQVPGGWKSIYEANRAALNGGANVIRPGQTLTVG